MRVSLILSRFFLFAFSVFALVINQFSHEQIENFLLTIPYRCPLRLVTGWKCAFCGMTHSWIAMFRGEWGLAFHENIFGPILLVMTLFLLIMLSIGKGVKLKPTPAIPLLVLTLMIYTVLRNL